MNLIARRKDEHQETTAVRVGDVIVGGPQLVVVAGPCAIESYEVHPQPDLALSDGTQSLNFEHFADLMDKIGPVAKAIGREMI